MTYLLDTPPKVPVSIFKSQPLTGTKPRASCKRFTADLLVMMTKRTLESFFSPPPKKIKVEALPADTGTDLPLNTGIQTSSRFHKEQLAKDTSEKDARYTSHTSWPVPIRDLPDEISEAIQNLLTADAGKAINNQPHLDLLYFQPLVPQPIAGELFEFLRSSLPFYRVEYTISRFGKEVQINTPRYTTVFGVDETSRFKTTSLSQTDEDPEISRLVTQIVESSNSTKAVSSAKYKATPRPIPPCLDLLRNLTEALTGETYNFCLVNYYANGADSISYHSDDERFLGPRPAIASFTLGARRDFLMKHKDPPKGSKEPPTLTEPIKLALGSGDMILMRGETQANWLHSIPKRKGGEADKGRINITMRKAMVPGGTENYYRYNVGEGEVYRWNRHCGEMVLWEGQEKLR